MNKNKNMYTENKKKCSEQSYKTVNKFYRFGNNSWTVHI